MKNLITSRLTAFLCAAVMALGLTACGAKITGLSLPAGAVLEKGETLQMDLQYNTETRTDADALAEAAEKLELVWTSDDETVAAVDENGLVTAVGAGETTIRVSSRGGELSGSCVVTVVVTARDLVVPDTLELVMNGQNSANLNASATPEDATGVTFTYTSSDETVATVDETGLVTAVANGEADITVTLTWTSSDESVATVDENGKVTAKKAGSAVITASCGDVSAQYNLTVQNVKCSYCGKTGHTSSSCPTKAADEAAQAAAQQAAQQQAQQEQAAQESGGSSAPDLNPDDYLSSQPSVDWTQDSTSNMDGDGGCVGRC